jgi:hypothetical protein
MLGEHLNAFRASAEKGEDAPPMVYTTNGKTFTSIPTPEGVMVDHVPAKLSLMGLPVMEDPMLFASQKNTQFEGEDSDEEDDEDDTNDDDDYDALENLENEEKFQYDSPLDTTCPLLYLKSVLESIEKINPELFRSLMGTLAENEVQNLVKIVKDAASYVQLVEQRRREESQTK